MHACPHASSPGIWEITLKVTSECRPTLWRTILLSGPRNDSPNARGHLRKARAVGPRLGIGTRRIHIDAH
jgi:hypothetical protein